MERDNADSLVEKWSKNGCISINKENEEVNSISIYYLADSFLYLTLFAVEEKSRGTHLAWHAINELRTIAKEKSLPAIELEVSKDNHRAYNFYVRQGFEILRDAGTKWYMRMAV